MSYELVDRAIKWPKLKKHERAVLICLAHHANHKNPIGWPSVETMSHETGHSPRQVYRALASLKAMKLILPKGRTKHGTVKYEVCIDANTPDHGAVWHCQAGTESVPAGHTNLGVEGGNGTGKTSIAPANPLIGKTQSQSEGNQTKLTQQKPSHATVAEVSTKKDSKIVTAWKTAHSNADLPCIVTPKCAGQLGWIAKLPPYLDYNEILTALIPVAVAEWSSLCAFLWGKFNIDKPPQSPQVGFLCKYRVPAMEYCSKDPETRKMLAELYAPTKATNVHSISG